MFMKRVMNWSFEKELKLQLFMIIIILIGEILAIPELTIISVFVLTPNIASEFEISYIDVFVDLCEIMQDFINFM